MTILKNVIFRHFYGVSFVDCTEPFCYDIILWCHLTSWDIMRWRHVVTQYHARRHVLTSLMTFGQEYWQGGTSLEGASTLRRVDIIVFLVALQCMFFHPLLTENSRLKLKGIQSIYVKELITKSILATQYRVGQGQSNLFTYTVPCCIYGKGSVIIYIKLPSQFRKLHGILYVVVDNFLWLFSHYYAIFIIKVVHLMQCLSKSAGNLCTKCTIYGQ